MGPFFDLPLELKTEALSETRGLCSQRTDLLTRQDSSSCHQMGHNFAPANGYDTVAVEIIACKGVATAATAQIFR